MTTGVYVLIIRKEGPLTVNVGALGDVAFNEGHLVYVGSAMGEGSTKIESRIQRHFSMKKKIHWHIDHLLLKTGLEKAIWAESTEHKECELADAILDNKAFELGPHNFGNSDCKRGCVTHLFRHIRKKDPTIIIQKIFRKINLQPRVWKKEETPLSRGKQTLNG